MEIPATIYAALGAVLAALIAGFFSFLNLVSSKENKVSEFRQQWIDGIRNEISEFAASLSELVRLTNNDEHYEEKDWIAISAPIYKSARENISKIQLRLNPEHVKNNPAGLDAKFYAVVTSARESFNNKNYQDALNKVNEIRDAAAPLLKCEWERVKLGEPGYRLIRRIAWITLTLLSMLLLMGSLIVVWKSIT